MALPILLFVVCLCGGAAASGQWLPDLAAGRVGGLAFFVVCGLLGAALALVAEHIYLIVTEVERLVAIPGAPGKAEVVGSGLRDILEQAGPLVGLAFAVYLLAPPPAEPDEPASDPIA